MTTKPELPLPHLTLLILLAVAARPRYGYEIAQEVEEQSDGHVHPSIGSMYLALQRLERQGLIASTDPPSETEAGRRKYYRATDNGRQLAGREVARLERLVGVARERELVVAEVH